MKENFTSCVTPEALESTHYFKTSHVREFLANMYYFFLQKVPYVSINFACHEFGFSPPKWSLLVW